MKRAHDLNIEELREIVDALQSLAFGDTDDTNHVAWDRDKTLGSDFIGEVVLLLGEFGLAPDEVPDETHERRD